MSNNWSYSKGEPRKEPLDIAAHKIENESAEKKSLNEVAVSYQKGEGVLIPKAFIVIVTGGEREEDYFKRVSDIEKLKVASFVEPNFDKDDEPRIFKFAIDKVEDLTHGFGIPDYNIQFLVNPQETKSVTFIADKPGVYRYYCTNFCHALHLEMRGRMIVEN